MTEHCGDTLDHDETWFVCTLPAHHTGRHLDDMRDSNGDHPRAMTVQWDQEPNVIRGEVVP